VAAGIAAAGGRALAVRCDVARDADPPRAVAETVAQLGRLDVLVNNAGRRLPRAARGAHLEQWDGAFAVNLRGVFLMTRAALPELRRAGGGHVVNIASVAGSWQPDCRRTTPPSSGSWASRKRSCSSYATTASR